MFFFLILQTSSLHQVLELLDSDSVEPSIRNSALVQVSVMMTDPFIYNRFLESNGLQIILKILHNSLLESQHHVFPDFAIRCVSILKNICLHKPIVREELSMNIDLFFCLLRGWYSYFILYLPYKCSYICVCIWVS